MAYKVILPPKVDPKHMVGSPPSQGPVIPVISEIKKDEVTTISNYWRENFGITLNREKVRKHLETLRRWEAKRLKTHE